MRVLSFKHRLLRLVLFVYLCRVLYVQLFISFFKIGLFGFGGGYAILSLIQHETEVHQWMTSTEFTDMVALSQMTPGPIGINAATYVGYIKGGLLGSCIATTAIVMPSFIIMLVLCRLYMRLKDNATVEAMFSGLRPAVIGLIAAAALLLMTPDNFISPVSWIIFGTACLLSLMRVHPILIILLAAVAGLIIY